MKRFIITFAVVFLVATVVSLAADQKSTSVVQRDLISAANVVANDVPTNCTALNPAMTNANCQASITQAILNGNSITFTWNPANNTLPATQGAMSMSMVKYTVTLNAAIGTQLLKSAMTKSTSSLAKTSANIAFTFKKATADQNLAGEVNTLNGNWTTTMNTYNAVQKSYSNFTSSIDLTISTFAFTTTTSTNSSNVANLVNTSNLASTLIENLVNATGLRLNNRMVQDIALSFAGGSWNLITAANCLNITSNVRSINYSFNV